jgi:hypothetical protein
MSIAMIAIAETGAYGSQANAAAALTIAMITPTVRPHTAPAEDREPGEEDDDPADQVDPSPR